MYTSYTINIRANDGEKRVLKQLAQSKREAVEKVMEKNKDFQPDIKYYSVAPPLVSCI